MSAFKKLSPARKEYLRGLFPGHDIRFSNKRGTLLAAVKHKVGVVTFGVLSAAVTHHGMLPFESVASELKLLLERKIEKWDRS